MGLKTSKQRRRPVGAGPSSGPVILQPSTSSTSLERLGPGCVGGHPRCPRPAGLKPDALA